MCYLTECRTKALAGDARNASSKIKPLPKKKKFTEKSLFLIDLRSLKKEMY